MAGGLRSQAEVGVIRGSPQITAVSAWRFHGMAIRIKARGGESAEQMLRRFKKLCEKEGLTKDVKKRQYYEKPSERSRREARKREARVARASMLVR